MNFGHKALEVRTLLVYRARVASSICVVMGKSTVAEPAGWDTTDAVHRSLSVVGVLSVAP